MSVHFKRLFFFTPFRRTSDFAAIHGDTGVKVLLGE